MTDQRMAQPESEYRSLRRILSELQQLPNDQPHGALVRELIEKLESLGIPV